MLRNFCLGKCPEETIKPFLLRQSRDAEDRPIAVHYATRDEAAQMGVRKLPERAGEIRLIDIKDFDLNACGGTHAQRTGQIGGLLIRRTEKVKQGLRVEFVCGLRAVKAARRDFEVLTEASAMYPCAPSDLPANISKQREDARAHQRREGYLLEELAELKARQLMDGAGDRVGPKVIVQVYEDRDANFIKLLAQKLTKSTEGVIALLASVQVPPTLVFARSSNLTPDVGKLLRELVTAIGGRGGGGKDFAQGGVPEVQQLHNILAEAQRRLG